MLITHVGCLLNFDTLAGTSRTEPPAANASASTASLVDTNTHETYLLRQLHTCNELSCIAVPGRLLLYMRLILFCFWAGRDPDSCPPTNALQRLIQFVHTGYQWTGTAEFTFKYLFISIALRLPTIFRRTAHFYYVEKGICYVTCLFPWSGSHGMWVSDSLHTTSPPHLLTRR
ncbi:hypothetical protein DFH09DRAFT_213563 [Mycena vulgaris]|nr:hypothetical protein DFH09DRAFT_213563 [Mycena vulgaris]